MVAVVAIEGVRRDEVDTGRVLGRLDFAVVEEPFVVVAPIQRRGGELIVRSGESCDWVTEVTTPVLEMGTAFLLVLCDRRQGSIFLWEPFIKRCRLDAGDRVGVAVMMPFLMKQRNNNNTKQQVDRNEKKWRFGV